MKKITTIITVLLTSTLLLIPVEAKEQNHFITKADNEVSKEDATNGSVALAGETVEYKGKAKGISFLAGNKVNFNGKSEYAIIAANQANINGTINNDTIIAGNIVTVGKEAIIKRDAIVAGATVEINGNINRNISIYASSVSIKDAQINGNLKIYATNIKIDKDVKVIGTLSYPKDADIKLNNKAAIGKIVKTKEVQTKKDNFAITTMNEFMSLMSLLLILAILTLIAPKLFKKIENTYEKFDFNKALETFTKGLVLLVMMPLVMFALVLISFGIPLALILLAIYIITIYLSPIFSAYLLGYKLWQKFFDKDMNMLIVGILGLSTLFILYLIPGINALAKVIITIIGIGILYDTVIKKISSR